jgi:hypothetical protein
MCWHDFFRAELGAFLFLAHNTKIANDDNKPSTTTMAPFRIIILLNELILPAHLLMSISQVSR